ncbi:TIGR02265 family protein [Cystobacter fuscus]|uniref:TIGR02265 family protein n=1 Tax=Cystobacter fuscus TaxID=43 RepID=UPI002B2CCB27|nr:DUF2378 family protein [Cystobacter fuscus]
MSGLGAEAYRVQTGAELGHLLTWLGPEDTLRGMFFRSLQDAMLTLLGEAAMEACLEEVSGERDFVDFFAYPAVDFLRMVRRAAWLMEERGCEGQETLRMLGHLGTAAFLKSPAGKAMDVLASGTPRRVLENLPMAYQMLSPKGGPLSVTALGPTRARVNFSRDVLPCAYLEGLLEALLKKAGARGVRIEGRRVNSFSCEFLLSWTEGD